MKFVFRTDVHATEKSPASWKGDYLVEIQASLIQIGELAKGAVAVLDGGDFFHIKAATRNSHALVAQMAATHAAYPCPVYAIEGNHDLAYNNLESIDRQPLGVFFAAGVFRQLRDQVFESEGLRVRVVGVPYAPDLELQTLRAIRKQPGDDYLLVVVHAFAAENPSAMQEEFFGEAVFKYSDLISKNGPDCLMFGHWHQDQGVVQIGNTIFVNQGSVSRGALIKENLKRVPKVAVIDVTKAGISVDLMPLRVAPAEDVFDLEAKVRVESEHKDIENFVAKLRDNALQDPATVIESSVSSLDFADDVRSAALHYLEMARTESI